MLHFPFSARRPAGLFFGLELTLYADIQRFMSLHERLFVALYLPFRSAVKAVFWSNFGRIFSLIWSHFGLIFP